MSEKKQLLIGAGVLVAIMAICIGVMLTDKKTPAPFESATPQTPLMDSRVTLLEQVATISFDDDSVVIPVPTGYCFADPKYAADRQLIKVIADMQVSYGNHFWLAYARCDQLKAVRVSNDPNAYIETGMLVTPLTFHDKKTSSKDFTSHLRQQLRSLDPVAFDSLVNDAAQENMSANIKIKSGQPAVFRDTINDLIFMLRHELDDPSTGPFTITEFDIVAAVRDRPLVAIFTYRNLTDPAAPKAFAEGYLTQLRTANVTAAQ